MSQGKNIFKKLYFVFFSLGEGEQYSFLIPVMKALVDKCYDMLNMATYLPSLPMAAATPTFFDDFKRYCQGDEWTSFMQKQVLKCNVYQNT